MSFLNELIERSFAVSIACSRLRDSGEKSFSKKNAKNARVRTILSESLVQATVSNAYQS